MAMIEKSKIGALVVKIEDNLKRFKEQAGKLLKSDISILPMTDYHRHVPESAEQLVRDNWQRVGSYLQSAMSREEYLALLGKARYDVPGDKPIGISSLSKRERKDNDGSP